MKHIEINDSGKSVRRRDKRVWYVVLGVFVAVFLFSFMAQKFKNDGEAEAASLAGFDPGYIISDWQMGNYNSMSEADIQRFLTAKNSCNNRDYNYYLQLSANRNYTWHWRDGHFVCLSEERFGDGEVIGSGDTAAHIIWQAAQDYRINPQVLLVLLQKETGLITDPIPNNGDYRKATGYGCPDTAPCSSQYYGFKNQVRKAAALFRTVLDGGWTNYPLGNNYIQYNPNAGCGGSVVNVRSLATSALYRYTPYQPNAGALAAGYGTAYCGAYGNRNFYLYFQDWFGGITDEYSRKYGRTIPEGKYQITSKQYSARAFDIYGGITPGMMSEKVTLYNTKERGADNQTFAIRFNSASGYYEIYNEASELYLNVNDEVLRVSEKGSGCGYEWNIRRNGGVGYYVLESACSGKSLVASSENEIMLRSDAQGDAGIWKLFEVSPESHALEDGTYQISTALSNKMVVDIKGGVTKGMISGEVDLWSKKRSTDTIANQLFDVKYDEKTGFYTIANHLTGLQLDVYNGNVADGTKVIVWKKNEGCNQRWMIKRVEEEFEIISACSGKALDVPNGTALNGQGLIIYGENGGKNQKWLFEEAQEEKIELGDQSYIISVSENAKMVLDVSGGVRQGLKTGDMIIYGKKKENNANQLFKFKETGVESEYYIYNPETNLYLDVYNREERDGARVILWQYNGGCNQRWKVTRTEDSYYQIASVCSDKVLDVQGGRISSLSPIIIFGNHGGANQKWLLTKSDN